MAEELELKDAVTSLKEAKAALDAQKTAFEAYKEANDAALDEVKAGGKADPLLKEKLVKIDAAIETQQKALDAFELSQKRSTKTYVDENGNPIDLDAKAQDWRDRVARRRNEQTEGFGHSELQEYKQNFLMFARKSSDHFGVEETKALSVGSDPDGGYLVPPDMSGRIAKIEYESSPMRQYASVMQTGSGSVSGIYDDNEVDFGWVGETGDRSETGTPEIGRWSIPVHEVYANPRATQRMLDDSDFNVEGWLIDKISNRFVRAENSSFCVGNGAERPRGFLTYANGTSMREEIQQKKTGVNGAFAAAPDGGDVLLDALYSLKASYRSKAVWFMNRLTVAAVRKLKDSNGAYLWAPGAAAGQPAMLMGYPQASFEDMPNIGTGSLSIAVGDMGSAYQIVERQGVRLLRDPYTSKPYVTFYATKRVGGGLVNGEALKLIKFAA